MTLKVSFSKLELKISISKANIKDAKFNKLGLFQVHTYITPPGHETNATIVTILDYRIAIGYQINIALSSKN